MNEALRELILGLNHTVKQSDVHEQFNNTLLAINNEVMPGLKSMNDLIKLDNIKIADLPEFGMFNKASEIKAKDLKGLVAGITKILTIMEKESNDVTGLIEKELPELISRDIITVKQATILNIVNNYNSVALYTLDLLMYLVTLSDVKINHVSNDMVKPKVQEIRVNMVKYANILKFFANTKNISKTVSKLSNDRVIADGKDNGTLSVINPSGLTMKISGFIGNPIYHVKMWLVDRQMNRYEVLKEKKRLLELKIMDLKSRSAGENNAKLEKSIQYYEDKLSNVEYKMRKVEEN